MKFQTNDTAGQSTMSKSVTGTAELANIQQLQEGKTSFLDSIFPLMDEMYKKTQMPTILYYLMLAFFTCQMASLSFWPGITQYLDFSLPWGTFVSYFIQIFLFYKNDDGQSQTSTYICFGVLMGFAAILFIVIAVQTIVYKIFLRMSIWTLYPTRILLEIIPAIGLCPVGNLLGVTLLRAINNKSVTDYVLFAFSLILAGVFTYFHFINAFFQSYSAYITSSPIALWHGWIYFSPPVVFSLIIFVSYVLQLFMSFFEIIIFVVKIAFCLVLCFQMFYFPFLVKYMNYVFASFFEAVIVADIIYATNFANIHLPWYVMVAAFLGTDVIMTGINYIIFKKRYSKFASQLKASSVEELDPEDAAFQNQPQFDKKRLILTDPKLRAHYEKLGIDTSERLALTYLQIGIAEISDLFLDWSLIKYISEFHTSPRMKCILARFISFFPSEARTLSFFFRSVVVEPTLSYSERFMLYQINKVKNQRESSASKEISERIFKLKQAAHAGISNVIKFWDKGTDDPNFFYALREYTKRTKSMFKETIENWPNNIVACEEYASFLIECATDFQYGLFIKHRAELIEMGKNFVIDLSFKSLVRRFPNYLKKGIMTVKGTFVTGGGGGAKGSSSQSSQGSSNLSLMSSQASGVLEMEIEDEIGKSIFKYHKLRMGLQRALEGRKSNKTFWAKVVQTWSLLILAITAIVILVFYFSIFDSRAGCINWQMELTKARYGYDVAAVAVTLNYAHNKADTANGNGMGTTAKIINDTVWEQLGKPAPPTVTNNFNLVFQGYDPNAVIKKWIISGRDSFQSFLDMLIDVSIAGTNLTEQISSMIQKTTKRYTCQSNGKPVEPSTYNDFRSMFINNLISMEALLIFNSDDWDKSQYTCEFLKNMPAVVEASQNLAFSLADYQEIETDNTANMNLICLAVLLAVNIIFVLPFICIAYYRAYKELDFLLDMLKSVAQSDKEEAAKIIKRDVSLNSDTAQEIDGNYKLRPCSFFVIGFLTIAVAAGMIIGIYFHTSSTNNNFNYLNQWMMYGIARTNLLYESILGVLYLLLIQKYKIQLQAVEYDEVMDFTTRSLEDLSNFNNYVLRGKDGIPGVAGYNADIDRLNIEVICHPFTNNEFHDSYACSSLDKMVSMFVGLADQIANDPQNYPFIPNGNFYHMYHIANVHIVDPMYESGELIAHLSNSQISSYRAILVGVVIGLLAVGALIYGLFWYVISKVGSAFEGAMQLLRRLPPMSVTQNPKVNAFIMNKKLDKRKEKMSLSHTIIHNSKNSIICLSRSETIDTVNQAVTELLGYTPEQVLGQHFSIMLPENSSQKIYETFELMRNGQSKPIVTEQTNILTDSETEIPVSLTIIGMTEPQNPTVATSFAIIIRDETHIQAQKEKAEKAKAQSEKLLYQILPRDIVQRLNQGETDIAIEVPSASIIFIDIVKFSDYAANLNPSQIMENLSTIFAKFDKACSAYHTITKIKLIGDVYMAAGGIFNQDEAPSVHAEQVVKFGLDCLTCLEEANIQLEASLQIRIGVNTDGPIIAGVLGTDKPMFDIIGDPINVAARLQSTCIPGTVQISQSTFEKIQSSSFNIESRGEIELKGKGKRKAYIVRSLFNDSMLSSYDDQSKKPPANP